MLIFQNCFLFYVIHLIHILVFYARALDMPYLNVLSKQGNHKHSHIASCQCSRILPSLKWNWITFFVDGFIISLQCWFSLYRSVKSMMWYSWLPSMVTSTCMTWRLVPASTWTESVEKQSLLLHLMKPQLE